MFPAELSSMYFIAFSNFSKINMHYFYKQKIFIFIKEYNDQKLP